MGTRKRERERERAMETRKEFLKWRYNVKKDEFWGENAKQKRERRSFRSCKNHPKKLPKRANFSAGVRREIVVGL
jgi:hypothetical protein